MDREVRDRLLLEALADWASEWVDADLIARSVNYRAELPRDERLSATGVGRILSRLADEGRCRKRSIGYMNRYKP